MWWHRYKIYLYIYLYKYTLHTTYREDNVPNVRSAICISVASLILFYLFFAVLFVSSLTSSVLQWGWQAFDGEPEKERERDAAARATTDTDKQCPYNALHPSFRQGYQPCFIDAKLYIKCMWNIRSTGNIDPSSNFHRNNIGNMMCLCVCLGSGSLFFVAYQHDHNIRVYILPIWQTGEQASVWMVLKFTLRHCWKKKWIVIRATRVWASNTYTDRQRRKCTSIVFVVVLFRQNIGFFFYFVLLWPYFNYSARRNVEQIDISCDEKRHISLFGSIDSHYD